MNIVEGLRSLVGAERVVVGDDVRDTWPLRLVQDAVGGAAVVRPLCVIRPSTTEEVSAVLGWLYERRVPVVPRGGGSGVGGGAEPASPLAVVLDVAGLRGILELDEENLLVRARAGTPFAELTAAVERRGFVLGHYPQSLELAQLGGLVATRSSGQFSTR
jgi:alkyldihydroxyacetonephosphate synthase